MITNNVLELLPLLVMSLALVCGVSGCTGGIITGDTSSSGMVVEGNGDGSVVVEGDVVVVSIRVIVSLSMGVSVEGVGVVDLGVCVVH